MGITWKQWAKAAVTPRMLLLLTLALLGALLFIRLGAWQLDRAAIRGVSEAEQITAERIAAAPVPLEDAIQLGEVFMSDHQLVKVEAAGEWGESAVVRGRQVDGETATLRIAELRLESGAMIPVVLGWVPDADASVAAGVPPEGEGSVVGYLSASEDSRPGTYPDGEVGSVSTAELANTWGGPTYTGFIVAEDGAPWSVNTMPPPSYSQEQGMNLQSLAYAAEWFIFGGFALFLWARWVRDDAVRERERQILEEHERALPEPAGD